MSELKKRLHEMIDALPENKIVYFVRIVSDLQNMLADDADEFDIALSRKADEAVLRGEFISLDTAVKDMGFTVEQFQH